MNKSLKKKEKTSFGEQCGRWVDKKGQNNNHTNKKKPIQRFMMGQCECADNDLNENIPF